MKIGWRQALGGPVRRRSPIIIMITCIISAFFQRTHSRCSRVRHFYFFFVFLFSGNWRAVPPPPHMNTDVASRSELWRCLQVDEHLNWLSSNIDCV